MREERVEGRTRLGCQHATRLRVNLYWLNSLPSSVGIMCDMIQTLRRTEGPCTDLFLTGRHCSSICSNKWFQVNHDEKTETQVKGERSLLSPLLICHQRLSHRAGTATGSRLYSEQNNHRARERLVSNSAFIRFRLLFVDCEPDTTYPPICESQLYVQSFAAFRPVISQAIDS